ncbi:hypothetical protein ACWEQ8_39305 [Streptomyces noursei]
MDAELARITNVETSIERGSNDQLGELAYLAPAAAAALQLLADAIKRCQAGQDDVLQRLQEAGVHTAFAGVLDAASDAAMNETDDPFDVDYSLDADNLSAAAREVRDAFRGL